MKFKKGDRVRILNGSKINDYAGCWVGDMKKYVGKIATVERGETFALKTKYFLTDCGGYCWDERGLELVTNESIVIYRNGDEVIALDKNTGKKGVAKCSPEDAFDFNVGAKIAFERLIDNGEVKEVKREAKVGEYIKIVKAYLTGGKYDDGDILKVVKTFPKSILSLGYVRCEGIGDHNIVNSEYVVLENYNPIKIVKQDKYEVGDKVKIVDKWNINTCQATNGAMDKWLGKVMTVKTVGFDTYRMEEDAGWLWNNACIEGKVVVDSSFKKEVKDEPKFKVGDVVEILTEKYDIPVGTRGTVKKVSSYDCVVDFHVRYERTHNCICLPTPTGLFLNHYSIKKVSE